MTFIVVPMSIRRNWFRASRAQYGVDRLVWFEVFDNPSDAIKREKAIKKWRRDWKIRLIEEQNPDWHDLFPELESDTTGHSGAQAKPARPEPTNTDFNK